MLSTSAVIGATCNLVLDASNLDPVWALTLDAAKRKGLRVAFRIQLSNTSFQPEQVALPPFLRERIPLVKIGRIPGKDDEPYREPRYDHPQLQEAFAELNDLLAAEFEGNPLIEWMDLMRYGFWGERHTSNFPDPFPDYVTAERTFVNRTARQLDTWKTPLAVHTQPGISNVGNCPVIDMAMRAGAWMRSDKHYHRGTDPDRGVSQPAAVDSGNHRRMSVGSRFHFRILGTRHAQCTWRKIVSERLFPAFP